MWRFFASSPLSIRASSFSLSLRSYSDVQTSSSSRPPLHVNFLYGTQSGTALAFAKQLVKESSKKKDKYQGNLINLANFHPSQMFPGGAMKNNTLNVFVMATFGKGEPTDNSKKFCDWLFSPERDNEKEIFQNQNFCMFGLGMSCTYKENYQKIPREVTNRLTNLGACLVGSRGEGDDSKDIEADFEDWCTTFWPLVETLRENTSNVPGEVATPSTPPPPSSSFVEANATAEKEAQTEKAVEYDWENPLLAPLVEIKVLTNPSQPYRYRTTKHFEFDIGGEGSTPLLKYETGDYVSILPPNLPHTVDKCLEILKADPNEVITPADDDSHPHVPRFSAPTTLKSILTNYLDLETPPKRSLLRFVSEFATDDRESHSLLDLTSTTDDTYDTFILRDNRSLISVLEDYRSLNIPVLPFLDQLAPIKPRMYSIANTPSLGFRQGRPTISTCIRIVWGPAPDGRPFFGKTSYFLDHSTVGTKVPLFVTKSGLRLPRDPSSPIILMAIGTGISAMRAFWQQRCILDREKYGADKVGDCLFFFGCDDFEDDYYTAELDEISKNGSMELHRTYALLREDPRFIQDDIRKCGKRISDLVDEGAHIYMCGHKHFSSAAERALVDVFMRQFQFARHEAVLFLKKMETQGRLDKEIFE